MPLSVWTATRIDLAGAREVVRQGLGDADETVRQAALHSVSLRRDPEAVPALLQLLKGPSAQNRRGAAEALGRVAANTAVLARIADGAERSADGVGPWSPDGWVMRTHPDLTEALERASPDDLRMIVGVAALVDPADRIYAVGRGTSSVWLRVPSGPAYDDAIGGAAFLS